MGRGMGPGRTARRGFTVFELLLVIVVVSMVAAVTVPAFFSLPEVSLENASILLANDLRTAQNQAAFEGRAACFRFLPDGDGYVVTDATGNVLENPATGRAFERSYSSDGVFKGVWIRSARTGREGVLRIDDHGRPRESAHVTLSFRGDSRDVLVEEGTGRLTILGSTSGWVDRGF
jgi:prepilin-type N-terminal cleavage/methylation domain-containing protein